MLREDVPLYKGCGDTVDTSIAVAEFGHRTALLIRISSDTFGKDLIGLLEANGVGTVLVQRDRLRQTGLSIVSYKEDGHRFAYYMKDWLFAS